MGHEKPGSKGTAAQAAKKSPFIVRSIYDIGTAAQAAKKPNYHLQKSSKQGTAAQAAKKKIS